MHSSSSYGARSRFGSPLLSDLLMIWRCPCYRTQAQTFAIFQRNEVSVDVVATSEVSISLTLDPSKIWSRDLIGDELEALKARHGCSVQYSAGLHLKVA